MPIFLHALGLKHYRGIGEVEQFASPLRECNFFIGANNSGKSAFLNFISLHLNDVFSGKNIGLQFKPWEVHLGSNPSQVGISIGFPLGELMRVCKETYQAQTQNSNAHHLEKLISCLASGDLVWFVIDVVNLDQPAFKNEKQIKSALEGQQWASLWRDLTRQSQGDLNEHWIPQVLNWIAKRVSFDLPRAHIIPALRRIGEKQQKFDDYSGKGLIDRLAELQNPSPDKRNLYQKFTKINSFLKDITADPDIQIEVPHDREELLVHKDGRVLPMSSLGTGIHEVVMIAAFCTLIERSIVCIEEPEVHLHPLLQKKLLRYLMQKTDNQYFVATHSASIIDQPGAAVFHVTLRNSTTSIEHAAAPSQRFRVCQDLGYKASDLLQTNFIVWVEGPTDRIYLNIG